MKKFLIFLFAVVAFSCTHKNSRPEGGDIAVTWKLISNDYLDKGLCKSVVTLTNQSNAVLDNKGWKLYFNYAFCRKIHADSMPSFMKISHINGDFFRLAPTEDFSPLKPGESIDIPLIAGYVSIKYSDAPGGFYFVFNEGIPEPVKNYSIIPFEDWQVKWGKNDVIPVPSAASIYNENNMLSIIAANEIPQIIPRPLSVKFLKGEAVIDASTVITCEKGLEREAAYLAAALKNIFNKQIKISEEVSVANSTIILRKSALKFSASPEAYTLSVNKNNIIIKGNDKAGVFYGIQSLRALFPPEAWSSLPSRLNIPFVEIEDAPSFTFRGIMLEVVRNFQPKDHILKMLDIFSFYKINKLTLHLADDEGWRLEIKGLPELTEISSKRGHTLNEQDRLIPSYGGGPEGTFSPANGFYSREDFIEILKYAKERHIEVIPEIDLPGHARAAIKAMDVRYNRLMAKGDRQEAEKYLLHDLNDKSAYLSVQLFNDNVICPCQEGIFNFIGTVVDEFKSIYREADATLSTFHIGGDEVPEGVWKESPACQEMINADNGISNTEEIKSYFFKRAVSIINENKLTASGYEDLAIHWAKYDNGEKRLEMRDELKNSDIRLISWCNGAGWGGEDFAYRMANAGFPVVIGHVTNFYFDLAYTKFADDPGQYWGGLIDVRKGFEYLPYNFYYSLWNDIDGNPLDENALKDKIRLSEKGRKNIVGVQGLLWSETLKSTDMIEYYLFPKMIGLAERGWAKEPSWATVKDRNMRKQQLEKDWNIFANAIGQRELPRMEHLAGGVNYYIPAPGAIVEDGILKANCSYPGLMIRYTTDGTDPLPSSALYTGPVKIDGKVKIASFSPSGRRGKILSPEEN